MPLADATLAPLRSRFGRLLLSVGLLAGFNLSAVYAAAPCRCGHCPTARWHIVETANLRILNYGPHSVEADVAEACESLRCSLVTKWLGATADVWTPKCDVVLHPSDAAYLREVGNGGRSTVASAVVDRQQGRVVRRRVDVRSTKTNWQTSALGHELTHVVLADRFADRQVPRWADEGAAILADPVEKRRDHQRDLHTAVAGRAEFRLAELITLADYPAAQRWGTFYGQSASLVEFLVAQGGEEQFVRFVHLAANDGYERALQQTYRLGTAELERRWRGSLSGTPVQTVATKSSR